MALNSTEHVHTSDPLATSITSVALRGDTAWCGLTGGRKCLVPFDLKSKSYGDPVDVFPWVDERPQPVQCKVHNALGVLDDGRIAIGEGILFTWDGIPFEFGTDQYAQAHNTRRTDAGLPPQKPGVNAPTDVSKFDLRSMTGGKVLLFDPDSGQTEIIGQVPPTTYVQSMVVDPKRNQAYGHTIGGCMFFHADFDAKRVEMHGRISIYAFHNMVVLPDGRAFGAWIDFDAEEKLRVLRFDPAKGFVERLKTAYLDDPGPRVQGNRGIDQWLVHSSGDVYVGMAGTGLLYKFDPEALTFSELGKIGSGGRVTSLDEDEKGRVLFSSGFPQMNLGRYDPATGRMEDFGPVCDTYDHIYYHGSVYHDGTLYLAETDSGMPSLWEVTPPE